MTPTWPWLTRATSSWKPARPSAERPVRPRSASMMRTWFVGQPAAPAWFRRSYWSFRLSLFAKIWCGLDWRTYTTARRLKWVGWMVSGMPMEHLLENSDEILNDPLPQVVGEPAPDALRWSGHEPSHSCTRERRSSRAALVSLVRGGGGASGARSVADTGMRRRVPCR